MTTPSFDVAAERALVGGAIAWPDSVAAVCDDLSSDAFGDVQLGLAWESLIGLIAKDRRIDAVVVADRVSVLGGALGSDDLAALAADALPPRREHVEVVLRHHAARQMDRVLTGAKASLAPGVDPFDLAARMAAELDAIGARAGTGRPEALTLPELIERGADTAPWVVPGLLRSDWRVVVVGSEGSGKSTLFRQIAICAGQGVHPFTFERTEPVRTLILDAENPLAAIAETGSWLDERVRGAVGDGYDADRCRVWSRPGGLDLREPADRAAFVRELRAQCPALVVAGPIYKLGRRRPSESYEDAAEGLLAVLDDLRTRFGFALVLEHHAPKAQGGRREMAPFGSQRWLAWPEIGIGLVPDRDRPDVLRLDRFRGDRLRSWWPDQIVHGRDWPFIGEWDGGPPDVADYDRPSGTARLSPLPRKAAPAPLEGRCPKCGADPPRQGIFGIAACVHQVAAANGHGAPDGIDF